MANEKDAVQVVNGEEYVDFEAFYDGDKYKDDI